MVIPSRRATRAALAAVLLCSCTCRLEPAPREPEEEEAAMADQGHVHHAIDYVEINVTDMAAAKRFYEGAFDWTFNDYGPDYAGIRKPGGGESGGLRQVEEVAAGGPLVILYSRDLEASLARVRKAGGLVVVEPFSFPGGRRFQFRDPSGNELAVWSDG